MNLYLSLPILFLKFWYFDALLRIAKYFLSVNHMVLQVLSLPLLIRTFFRPLKNEYRKGLVAFSIIFGIVLKSSLIFIDLFMFSFVIFMEIVFILFFLAWPF